MQEGHERFGSVLAILGFFESGPAFCFAFLLTGEVGLGRGATEVSLETTGAVAGITPFSVLMIMEDDAVALASATAPPTSFPL